MILISYIIPIYNAECYIDKCIQSVLKQPSNEIELILVDDGSKDSTPIICDKYAKEDKRVKSYHLNNGGVSKARNFGLNVACGEFIRFVDADDCINDIDEVAVLSDVTIKADYIVAMADIFDNESFLIRQIRSKLFGIIDSSYVLNNMDASEKEVTFHYVWNHFYRRRIIVNSHILFDETVKLGEDFLFNIAYFKYCNKVLYLRDVINLYYKRDNDSLTRSFRKDELSRRRRMDLALISAYQDKNAYDINKSKIDSMIGAIAFSSLEAVRFGGIDAKNKDRISYLKNLLNSEYYDYIDCFLNSKTVNSLETLLIKKKIYLLLLWVIKLKYRQN